MNARTMRIAAASTAVLLGLGIAGCSNSTTTSSSSSGDTATSAEATTDGVVQIEYVHRLPDGDGMTKVADIVARWNAEHPEIQVTATKWDGKADELHKQLETDVNAEAAPCLAQLGYHEIPGFFAKGLLEDVTDEAAKYADNFSAGAMGLTTVGGVVVGLPQDTGPLVYYYNKAEFEKLGISVPTTLDEFKAAAKTAKDAGKYISAFTYDDAAFWLSAQAAAAGGTWYSAEGDAWVVDANDEASAVVAEFWQSMLDDGTTLPEARWGETFPVKLNDQTLIGTIGAAWDAPLMADAMAGTANEGQWAVAQLPDFGKGALTGPDGGSAVAVLKGCADPAAAMEFNNWFNTQVDDLVSQGLVVAATTAPMTTPENIAAFYGGQDVFAELAKANAALAPNFPYIPYFTAVSEPMGIAADSAAKGTGKVADIFVAAQEASIKALKDAGLNVAE